MRSMCTNDYVYTRGSKEVMHSSFIIITLMIPATLKLWSAEALGLNPRGLGLRSKSSRVNYSKGSTTNTSKLNSIWTSLSVKSLRRYKMYTIQYCLECSV